MLHSLLKTILLTATELVRGLLRPFFCQTRVVLTKSRPPEGLYRKPTEQELIYCYHIDKIKMLIYTYSEVKIWLIIYMIFLCAFPEERKNV